MNFKNCFIYIFFLYTSLSFAAPLRLETVQIKFAELKHADLNNDSVKPIKVLKVTNLVDAKIVNDLLWMLPGSDEGKNQNASVEFLAENKKIYSMPIIVETARSSAGWDESIHGCKEEKGCQDEASPNISSEIKGLLPFNLITPETSQIEIKINNIPQKIDLDLNESKVVFQGIKNGSFSFKEISWNKTTSILTIKADKIKAIYEKLPNEPIGMSVYLLSTSRDFSVEQKFTIQKAPIHLKIQITNLPPEGWKSLIGKSISIIGEDSYRKLVKIKNKDLIDIGYVPRDSSFSYWITLEDADFPNFFKQSIALDKKNINEIKFEFNLKSYCDITKCLSLTN